MRYGVAVIGLVVFALVLREARSASFENRPSTSVLTGSIDAGTWIGYSIEERSTALLQMNHMLPAENSSRGLLVVAKDWIAQKTAQFVDDQYNGGNYTGWLNATSYWEYTHLYYCKIPWYTGAPGPYFQEFQSNSGPPMLSQTAVTTRALAPTNYGSSGFSVGILTG